MFNFNKSEIMKNAWDYAKKAIEKNTVQTVKEAISYGLKFAWAKAKRDAKKVRTREQAVLRLEYIVKGSCCPPSCEMYPIVSDWENYGKNRTYFKIVLTDHKGYYRCREYGYFDNIEKKYIPTQASSLEKDYSFSGMRLEFNK